MRRAARSLARVAVPRVLPRQAAGSVAGGITVSVYVAQQRPAPRCEAIEERKKEARARVWKEAWKDVVKHWLSILGLTLATLVSTVVDRLMLAGQVQQLMQLPGQMPAETVLTQLAAIFGVKAVHLIAECLRSLLATRLGQKLEARDRHAALERDQPVDERVDGSRLMVEAGPKLVVEIVYVACGALGALATSPPLAVYFVAHEALVGQLVGLGAAALAGRRDHLAAREQELREHLDADLDAAQIATNDAQFVLEKYMDLGQLGGLASFVLTASAFVDKGFVPVDKYQRVMLLASNTMQASAELAAAFEKFNKGVDHRTTLVLVPDDADN